MAFGVEVELSSLAILGRGLLDMAKRKLSSCWALLGSWTRAKVVQVREPSHLNLEKMFDFTVAVQIFQLLLTPSS